MHAGTRRVRRRDLRRSPSTATSCRCARYPGAHGGSAACAGWEHVLGLDLAGHAPRVAAEAVELLTAPPCPSGRATVVLGGEQLALQIHESIGHALELDRMLLGEASYAGTSWVSPADLGTLRYGSEQLIVTADATLPGGLGSFGWDDEGVAAARTPLIAGGILRAALSDRQSAAAIGLAGSGGCARADGFARQPIVRMTNVSIEPGDAGTLDDLIADTDDGLLPRDQPLVVDRRPPPALPVRHRDRARDPRRRARAPAAQPELRGDHAAVLASLDAVCSAPAWRLWGVATAARASRASSCASPTAPRPRASATCRSAWPDGERQPARRSPQRGAGVRAATASRSRSCASARCCRASRARRPRRRRRSTTRRSRSSPCATGTRRRRRRTASTTTRCARRPGAPRPPSRRCRARRDPACTPVSPSRRPCDRHDGLRRRDGGPGAGRRRRRAAHGVRACPPPAAARRSASGPRARCARRSRRRPGLASERRRDRRVHEGRLP